MKLFVPQLVNQFFALLSRDIERFGVCWVGNVLGCCCSLHNKLSLMGSRLLRRGRRRSLFWRGNSFFCSFIFIFGALFWRAFFIRQETVSHYYFVNRIH